MTSAALRMTWPPIVVAGIVLHTWVRGRQARFIVEEGLAQVFRCKCCQRRILEEIALNFIGLVFSG